MRVVTCVTLAALGFARVGLAQDAFAADAADVRVNGVRMVVRRAVVSGTPESLARALREGWERDERTSRDSASQSTAGDWTVVGRLSGALLETWQMRSIAVGQSELIASVTDVTQRPGRPAPLALGLPADSRLLSTTESTDRGRPVVAQLAHSRLSPPQLLEWVRNAAAARGWREMSVAESPRAGQGFVITHRRDGAQIATMAVTAPGGTRLVFNQVGIVGP